MSKGEEVPSKKAVVPPASKCSNTQGFHPSPSNTNNFVPRSASNKYSNGRFSRREVPSLNNAISMASLFITLFSLHQSQPRSEGSAKGIPLSILVTKPSVTSSSFVFEVLDSCTLLCSEAKCNTGTSLRPTNFLRSSSFVAPQVASSGRMDIHSLMGRPSGEGGGPASAALLLLLFVSSIVRIRTPTTPRSYLAALNFGCLRIE